MQLHTFKIMKCLHVGRSTDTLSLRAISKKNLPYFIGWIAIFIWLYSYFLPMGGFKFESKLYYDNTGNLPIYPYIWLIACCMITVFFDGKKFVPKTFYSVITASACFILIRYTGVSIISKGMMFIAIACIGHIFASNIYAFFMVLNNSEKFYSMILAVLLPKVLMFVKPVLIQTHYVINPPDMIIIVIIIILAVCSYFYKYNIDEMPNNTKIKAPSKAYSLMPLVFVVLALNDVIAPTSLHQISDLSKSQIESYYFFGILIGIVGVILLQKRFLINICNMLNISFALLAIGFVVNIISIQDSTAGLVSAFCFGSSYAIGFVNIYYLAGFMAKKFQSVTFYRVGIGLSTLYYFVAFIVLEVFKDSEILAPPTFMAFISICIVILFFILSPFFIKILYSGEWIDDTYRLDVTKCSRLEARLKDYKLTPAEIEVCRLLLDGCTLRQIAGVQSKAYPTINTYCTSIYRKLNINSRTELLLILQDYMEK
ncbi:MAG: helix-turn-helix transcriptional regulator [Lutisporaceae bacterium]